MFSTAVKAMSGFDLAAESASGIQASVGLPPEVSTIEDFFKVFNPKRQLYICQYPTYCITGPSPTLAQIDIMYGPFTSAKWLVPLIADVSLCCGLKEDASEDQLQLTATAILERYKWLKA